MLLRCCIVTLLLVGGCDQCLEFNHCGNSLCEFQSHEDGQSYTTRLTLRYIVSRRPIIRECLVGWTSHMFSAEGTAVSRVNVSVMTFGPCILLWKELQENISWIPKSPFVKDFWINYGPCATHVSVHVYNKSLNPTHISTLRAKFLTDLELTGSSWPTTAGLTLELPSLRKLSLVENQIEELHPGLLKDCPKLQVLDLSRNKIRNYTNVLYNVQSVRRSLTDLSLAENMISSVINIFGSHWWYFSWIINNLNLSCNGISSFDLWIIPMNCEVDLSFNNITEFPYSRYVFMVDRMDLAGKNISSLSELGKALSPFYMELFDYSIANVEIVYDLSVPALTIQVPQSECTVHRYDIHCLESASYLFTGRGSSLINLTGNKVKIDEYSAFEIWPVNLVDLSENKLKVLSDDHGMMSRTKHLNLSRNSIAYISSDVFQRMTRLTVVDLSYNELTYVQIILYSSLRMLDISNNNLHRMDISHSSSQYITECLNLSHNSFTNILKAEWSQFDHFLKVDLGGNNFECCSPEGQYSRAIFLHYQYKILNINSSKALTCVRPFYGRVEMTDTWLSEDHCQFRLQGWVGLGCLLILLPLIIHAVDLVDYFMHQAERDLAERLIRLKKQGLEEDENCALDCEYDAFVCHSHKDAAWVRYELVPNLENDRDGHRLCIHYRDFELGSFIEENVEVAMNTSRKVLVVVTRSFLQSNWCKMELTYAWEKMVREGRNYIIVIEVDRIPKGKRPPILSYLMRSRTYLEWPEAPTDDVKQHCWGRVRDALGKSLRDRQQELSESGVAAIQMDC